MSYISIVTTVYNGEQYLQQMLESVREQTYKNFEHILVDDGSTDNTVAIAECFHKENPNYQLKIIKTKKIGRGYALNLGVKMASNQWIAILDADDLWHPRKLEVQVDYVKKNKDVKILGTKVELILGNGEVNYIDSPSSQGENIGKRLLVKSNVICHSSVLICKDFCVYDSNRLSQFDYELWLRVINFGRVDVVKDVLTFHRIHKEQSFESKTGKIYNYRSFKLKLSYAIKYKLYSLIPFISVKLMFDIFLPKKVRIKIREFTSFS